MIQPGAIMQHVLCPCHGCTIVQAVVMVTTVLIGNGHLWTTVNKKCVSRLLPNFAKAITLVSLIYVHILVTIGSRETSRHMREI